jgi:hypothetical protein
MIFVSCGSGEERSGENTEKNRHPGNIFDIRIMAVKQTALSMAGSCVILGKFMRVIMIMRRKT